MSFRFRKRIRLLPGIWLNISRTGVSLSFGGFGFTTNLNRRGVMGTAGLRGSGLSYRTRRRRF